MTPSHFWEEVDRLGALTFGRKCRVLRVLDDGNWSHWLYSAHDFAANAQLTAETHGICLTKREDKELSGVITRLWRLGNRIEKRKKP
jgi:hypothetical protein